MIHTVTAMGSIVTKNLSSSSFENYTERIFVYIFQLIFYKFSTKNRLIGLKEGDLKMKMLRLNC